MAASSQLSDDRPGGQEHQFTDREPKNHQFPSLHDLHPSGQDFPFNVSVSNCCWNYSIKLSPRQQLFPASTQGLSNEKCPIHVLVLPASFFPSSLLPLYLGALYHTYTLLSKTVTVPKKARAAIKEARSLVISWQEQSQEESVPSTHWQMAVPLMAQDFANLHGLVKDSPKGLSAVPTQNNFR